MDMPIGLGLKLRTQQKTLYKEYDEEGYNCYSICVSVNPTYILGDNMANPFETIKKGISALNPFGGNATPPKEDKPIPKAVIKKKAEDQLTKPTDGEPAAKPEKK